MSSANKPSRAESHADADARSRRAAGDHSGMSLCTRFLPGITIVEVHGGVDACNADRLSDYAGDLATPSRPQIADLCGVNFFGYDGFRALARMAEKCHRRSVRWALVASEAVGRVLRITVSTYRLLIATSLGEALLRLTVHNHAWSVPHRIAPAEVTRY